MKCIHIELDGLTHRLEASVTHNEYNEQIVGKCFTEVFGKP